MSPTHDTATLLIVRPPGQDTPIETLLALHDGDVRSALCRVLGRSQEEDDLVQEVFTRLVVRLRQPGELCVGAWLRGVAHNLAVDEIRRRRPVPVEDARLDREVSSPAEDSLDGAELYTSLVEGAQGLPHRQRAALAASLEGGGPGVATVASSLGVSVHAAESLLSRARVGLRMHLAMAGGGGDDGFVRASLARALGTMGAVAAVAAWLLRRWRATAVLTVVTAGLTTAVWLPSRLDAPSATAAPPVAGAPASGVSPKTEAAGEPATEDHSARVPGSGSAPAEASSGDAAADIGPAVPDGQHVGLPSISPPVDVAVPEPCAAVEPASDLAYQAGKLVDPLTGAALLPPTDADSAARSGCAAIPRP